MKSKRLPQNSFETNQSLAEFTTRGESLFSQESKNEVGKVEEISSVLANCFRESDESDLRLSDEFSKKTITFVITRCREILQSASKDPACWAEVRGFLEEELWKISRLKENLVMAERKCQMVRFTFPTVSFFKIFQVFKSNIFNRIFTNHIFVMNPIYRSNFLNKFSRTRFNKTSSRY